MIALCDGAHLFAHTFPFDWSFRSAWFTIRIWRIVTVEIISTVCIVIRVVVIAPNWLRCAAQEENHMLGNSSYCSRSKSTASATNLSFGPVRMTCAQYPSAPNLLEGHRFSTLPPVTIQQFESSAAICDGSGTNWPYYRSTSAPMRLLCWFSARLHINENINRLERAFIAKRAITYIFMKYFQAFFHSLLLFVKSFVG